ncbi:MAG: Gfo/Idh/MocA family oxidoreductase [Candidatus Muirbacterium halophilum]|nr:Gfo/Idh/MocA family oxidoreductase [Candidatus Muirbacterium halophilum]
MKKFSVGVVGCGRISGKHFEAIEKIDELELISVCDIKKDRADKWAEKYSINAYYDYSEMLDNEELDIISICTPSGLHPEHGIMAANKKIHVLSEKPMGTNLKSADSLIKACDDNGVELFVVKQNRLNSTIRHLKNAIDKGRFGKIYFISCNVFWTRPQEYYDMAKWRGTWEFDGGAFLNQASHYVDLVHWFGGPIDSVMAFGGTLERKIETEDTGVAAIRFRNGAMGSINITMLTYPKNLEGSITVLGEKGSVKIGGIAVNEIVHWEFSDYDDDDKDIMVSNYQTDSVYGFGHTGYYKNVIETLQKKRVTDVDGREGRKSLELIMAIYKSMREGKRISLPLGY